MAAVRKLDNRHGGNRRQQSMPVTAGGWGGHTISKSFMELRDNYGDDRATHGLGEPMGPNNTFSKEKYMGPGHAQPPEKVNRAEKQTESGGLKQWGNTMDLASAVDVDYQGESTTSTRGSLRRGYTMPTGGDYTVDGSMGRDDNRESILKDSSLRRHEAAHERRRELSRSVTYAMDNPADNLDTERNRATNPLHRSYTYTNERTYLGPEPVSNQHALSDLQIRSNVQAHEGGVNEPRGQPTPTMMRDNTVELHRDARTTQQTIQATVHQPTTNIDDRRYQFTARSSTVPAQMISDNIRSTAVDRPDSKIEMDSSKNTWQAHWKVRDGPVATTQQLVTVQIPNLNIHLYDYLRRFKRNDLVNIADQAQIKHDVTVNIVSGSDVQTEQAKDRFLSLYRMAEENICIEELDIPGIHNIGSIERELVDKYAAMAYPITSNKAIVICEKQHRDDVINFVRGANRSDLERPMLGTIDRAHTLEQTLVVGNNVQKAGIHPQGYLVYGMVKVFLHVCDITKMHVDAIVNAANSNLQHDAGIARAISAAAGSELTAASESVIQRGGPVQVTQVVRTHPGGLPCRFVIHAVGPRWPQQQDRHIQDQCARELRDTYANTLGFAIECEVKSIAIPFVSSGIFGVPADVVTDAMFTALMTSIKKYFFHEDNHLREVHIVDIQPGILRVLAAILDGGHRTHGDQIIRHLHEDETIKAVSQSLMPKAHVMPPVRLEAFGGSRNPDIHFEFRGFMVMGLIRVVIAVADITKMNVDAIVNPSDERMSCNENISMEIASAAGPGFNMEIEDHLRHRGPIPPGQVIRTSPGHLACDSVIHLSGPNWPYQEDRNQQEQCLRDLQRGFDSVVDYACRNKVESLAIPLKSGMLKIPDQYTVTALHDAIMGRLREHVGMTSVKIIYIVDTYSELLSDISHQFNEDIRHADHHNTLITSMDGYAIENAMRSVVSPPYPTKDDSIRRRDYRPGEGTDYDVIALRERENHSRHSDRRVSFESSHSSENIEREQKPKNKKKKRIIATKKKKNSQQAKKSSGSGQHVTVHEKKKSNPLDCFKTGKGSAKHEITIEHPHYEDRERDPEYYNSPPKPLSYDSDDEGKDNGGFVDERRPPPRPAPIQQGRHQSHHGYPRDTQRDAPRSMANTPRDTRPYDPRNTQRDYPRDYPLRQDYHSGSLNRHRTMPY